ncbi:hypothetical protein [Microcoleus sp. B4-C1]|uniref:hypothetical protein n=1 Tax=Microcoleus sp. B4-C1 TaxID=2818660 RepID=UPI002FD1743B
MSEISDTFGFGTQILDFEARFTASPDLRVTPQDYALAKQPGDRNVDPAIALPSPALTDYTLWQKSSSRNMNRLWHSSQDAGDSTNWCSMTISKLWDTAGVRAIVSGR